MKRRSFLTTTAITTAAVIGSSCLFVSGSEQPPSGRKVTDVSVSVPDSARFTITPAMTYASITAAQTAQFELVVVWHGDDPTQFKFGNAVPFSYPQYSADASGLFLLPADAGVERRNKQTWIPKIREDGLAAPMVMYSPKLVPGETVTGTWELWGDPEEVSYIEPGTYQFKNSFLIEAHDEPISWTLTVTIEADTSSNESPATER